MVTIVGEEVTAAAEALVGTSLVEVKYLAIRYSLRDKTSWDVGAAHVACGVDLMTTRGTTGITWTPYGNFGYGVGLVDGPVIDMFREGVALRRRRLLSVAAGDRVPWTGLIGKKIISIKVHWFEADKAGDNLTGPAALTIRCEDAPPVALVCGTWVESDAPIYLTGDDIVVVWKAELVPTLVPHLDVSLRS